MKQVCECKDCENRHPGCHSTCEKYAEFTRKNDELRESVKRQKQADQLRIVISEAKRKRIQR